MRRWAVVASALPLAAAAAALVWCWRSGPVYAPFAAAPLTAYPGFATQPSLAPDGRRVAFSWNGAAGDNFDIYIKAIPEGAPVRLTSDPHREVSPAWSPDGTRIAFLRLLGGGRAAIVLKAPDGGAAERILTEIATPLPDDPGAPDLAFTGPFLSWSPDGRALVTHDRDRPQGPYAAFQVRVEDGGKRRLTTPPKDILGDLEVAVAPDGRSIAFTRYLAPGRGNIHRVDLSPGAKPRRLPTTNVFSFAPCWSADGRELLFSPSAAGPAGLWRIALFSSSRQRPVVVSADSAAVSPAAGSGRLVYARIERDVSLWVAGKKIAAEGWAPAFSPSGQRIAFVSDRRLWIASHDGSQRVALALAGPAVSGPSWSPGGRELVYACNPERFWDLCIISAAGGEPRQLTARPGNHFWPFWARDGWIYFTSTRSGRDEIWRLQPDGTGAMQITRGGGARGAVSPDGHFLYFVKQPAARALWRVALSGGAAEEVFETGEPFTDFALADPGIYLAGGILWPRRDGSIRYFDFAARSLREVERTPRPLYRGLSVAPGGRLAFTQVDRLASGLMLADGFR